MGENVLPEIISTLTGGITTMATNIGQGLNSLVTNIMTVTEGTGADAVTHLSAFGYMVCIFGGVGLAIGLSRLIVGIIRNFGN